MVSPVDMELEQVPEPAPATKPQLIPVGFCTTTPLPVPPPVAVTVTVGPTDSALRLIVWIAGLPFKELSFATALALIGPTAVESAKKFSTQDAPGLREIVVQVEVGTSSKKYAPETAPMAPVSGWLPTFCIVIGVSVLW